MLFKEYKLNNKIVLIMITIPEGEPLYRRGKTSYQRYSKINKKQSSTKNISFISNLFSIGT